MTGLSYNVYPSLPHPYVHPHSPTPWVRELFACVAELGQFPLKVSVTLENMHVAFALRTAFNWGVCVADQVCSHNCIDVLIISDSFCFYMSRFSLCSHLLLSSPPSPPPPPQAHFLASQAKRVLEYNVYRRELKDLSNASYSFHMKELQAKDRKTKLLERLVCKSPHMRKYIYIYITYSILFTKKKNSSFRGSQVTSMLSLFPTPIFTIHAAKASLPGFQGLY